jgi:regulator of nucleoside diphosphate kinase
MELQMTDRIYVSAVELNQLRSLVDHATGRDGTAAERLAAELDRAIVVEPDRMPLDVATIGSRVTFEDARTRSVRDVVLVYPGSADASAGRISVLAPVGAALLGLRTGEEIKWPLPDGRIAEIRILAVTQASSDDRTGETRDPALNKPTATTEEAETVA